MRAASITDESNGISSDWHPSGMALEAAHRSFASCNGFLRCRGTLASSTRQITVLRESRPCQEGEADRYDPEELAGIPDEQQGQQVQPVGAATVDDRGADPGGVEVGSGQEHGGDAPFEAASGADGVEHQVGGCVAEYAVASCAERDRCAEHCGSLFPRHSATAFRRGGGYEPSALEGAVP